MVCFSILFVALRSLYARPKIEIHCRIIRKPKGSSSPMVTLPPDDVLFCGDGANDMMLCTLPRWGSPV